MLTRGFRPCLVLLVLGLLSACGGGGGGSASQPAPSPQPPTGEPQVPVVSYTGNRLPAIINQTNAADLAFRVISVRELTQFVEAQWTDPPPGPAKEEETRSGRFGGEVSVRVDVDSSSRGFIEAVFEDYSDQPDEVINGRFVQRLRPVAGTPIGLDYSFAGPGSLEFDGFTVLASGNQLTLQGVVEIRGVDSNTFLVDLVVSQGPDGEALYYQDVTLRFSEVSVQGAPRPGVELSGTVYQQTEGAVEFTSLGPMQDLGANEYAGYVVSGAGGGIELLADGPATHFRSLSFAFASVIMDLDEDGTPETARRYSWPELDGEPAVVSSVFSGPIANTANQRNVIVGDTVQLHGLLSHDDDGDWLTFEWSLVTTPLFSSLEIDDPVPQPLIEFVPDESGDYVFRLRATDGVDASAMALVVHADPDGSGNRPDEPVGALEIGLPIVPSMPILIDAGSAIRWPYGDVSPSWFLTGFGLFSFSETGSPFSTYLTVEQEGLHQLRFSEASEFSGAPNSHAEVALAFGPAVFETKIQLDGESAYDIHRLDYNGDGASDLALRVGGPGSARLQILLSAPRGFTPGPEVPTGVGEVAPGDINADGRPDFLNAGDNGVSVYTQLADGSLSATVQLEYPAASCSSVGGSTDIGLVDIDGTNSLDIVAVHPCSDGIVRWLQRADGTFAAPTVIGFENHRITSAAFGDLNGDGRADYAVSLQAMTTFFESGVSILASQPDGSVSEMAFIPKRSLGSQGVTIGDVDADGWNDVVVININEVLLLEGGPASPLTPTTLLADSDGPSFQPAVSLVDVNEDGLRDIYFCTTGPGARLLLQSPDGSFDAVSGPRCRAFDPDQAEIAVTLDWNGGSVPALVTLAENALLDVYLQGLRLYPVPVTD